MSSTSVDTVVITSSNNSAMKSRAARVQSSTTDDSLVETIGDYRPENENVTHENDADRDVADLFGFARRLMSEFVPMDFDARVMIQQHGPSAEAQLRFRDVKITELEGRIHDLETRNAELKLRMEELEKSHQELEDVKRAHEVFLALLRDSASRNLVRPSS